MQDKQLLSVIADNPNLSETLRGLFEDAFSLDDVAMTLSDAEMGQIVRARLIGLSKIEDVFRQIALYKSKSKEKDTPNGAR